MRPTTILRPLLFAALLILPGAAARAHELGKIQIYATFLKDGTYRIDIPVDPAHLWPGDKGPAEGATRHGPIAGLTPEVDRQFGKFLRDLANGATISFDGAAVEPKLAIVPPAADDPPGRTTLRLAGPIPAGSRAFNFKEEVPLGTFPLVLLIEGEESSVWQWLDAGATSPPFSLAKAAVPPTRSEVVRQYLTLGYTHILPKGTDHILFVLGIFLLSPPAEADPAAGDRLHGGAHDHPALTSTASCRCRPAIVEPLIALSIVFVAVENILTPRAAAVAVALVFGFGLLHGMGFAGVLSEQGLPRSEFLPPCCASTSGSRGASSR